MNFSGWEHSRWYSVNDEVIQQLPYQVAEWLAEFGSLTQKLSNYVAQVQLDLIKEGVELPEANEAKSLGLTAGKKTQIREVTLFGPRQPWIFARTLVPESARKLILDLGQTPLGSILFTSSELRRISLEVAQLPPNHRLVQAAKDKCEAVKGHPYLWARRSLWANTQRSNVKRANIDQSINKSEQKKLLLLEVFLPDSPLYQGFEHKNTTE